MIEPVLEGGCKATRHIVEPVVVFGEFMCGHPEDAADRAGAEQGPDGAYGAVIVQVRAASGAPDHAVLEALEPDADWGAATKRKVRLPRGQYPFGDQRDRRGRANPEQVYEAVESGVGGGLQTHGAINGGGWREADGGRAVGPGPERSVGTARESASPEEADPGFSRGHARKASCCTQSQGHP